MADIPDFTPAPDFISYFDDYAALAAALTAFLTAGEWGQLPEPFNPLVETGFEPDLFGGLDLAYWGSPTWAATDPAFDGGSDLTRTYFGDIGGNSDTFYFFDPETGSSVMLD